MYIKPYMYFSSTKLQHNGQVASVIHRDLEREICSSLSGLHLPKDTRERGEVLVAMQGSVLQRKTSTGEQSAACNHRGTRPPTKPGTGLCQQSRLLHEEACKGGEHTLAANLPARAGKADW